MAGMVWHSLVVILCLGVICDCIFVPTVYIVMSVKTGKSIVKKSVASVLRHQSGSIKQKVLFVDDGSPKETITFEQQLCENQSATFMCLKNPSKGYTHAIKYGIETALSLSTHFDDAIVLLNSDVTVTQGWLSTLYQALMHDNETMIVGPVSNAATYQSVPQVKAGKGCCNWVTNPYPPGLELDTMSNAAREAATTLNIFRVPIVILNGFCYMFKKSLIGAIGHFDMVNFPQGYGEEVDFSLRAFQAGFTAYIVPAVYLYHEKTASFSESHKKSLKRGANPVLQVKYKAELKLANDLVHGTTSKQLEGFRSAMSSVYSHPLFKQFANIHKFSVMFLYDAKSTHGDILRSQLYDINALLALGVKVSVGVDQDAKASFFRCVRMLNFNPKPLLQVVYFHPNSDKDTEYLTSIKFIKRVERHDIIVGNSCEIVSKLVDLFPNLAKNMIVYQFNDFNMQKVNQFKTLYHREKMDSCTSRVVKENVHLVVNSAANARALRTLYPSSVFTSSGLSIDQHVYYVDDVAMHLRRHHLRNPISPATSTAPSASLLHVKHVTICLSTTSFSLQATAQYILDVAHVLIGRAPKQLIRVSVAQFGAIDTAVAFTEHLVLSKAKLPNGALEKLEYLLRSKQFYFFSGNDLKYGSLLRKSDVFVDLTHGHFSDLRVLEAMACGALVMTGEEGAIVCPSVQERSLRPMEMPYSGVNSNNNSNFISTCTVDTFQDFQHTAEGVLKMLAFGDDVVDQIVSRYMDVSRRYKLERRAAEWAVCTSKEFVSYRANHMSTSVGVVL